MSEKTGLGKTRLFSYVVLEKVVDFAFFVLLFFIITIASTAAVVGDILFYSGMAVTVAVGSCIIYIRFNNYFVQKLVVLAPAFLKSRIETLNSELLSGIYLFKSMKQLARSILLFLGSWLCIVIIFYLVSWPFLEPLRLPYYAPVVLMVFSALSLAIPSAPSAIGTMHFAFLIAITLMTDGQYDIDLAAGFIVVLHFFVILFDFVIGAVLLSAYNIKMRRDPHVS